jgi:hypothetical protein
MAFLKISASALLVTALVACMVVSEHDHSQHSDLEFIRKETRRIAYTSLP